MESLISRANAGSRYTSQDNNRSWKYDWDTPVRDPNSNRQHTTDGSTSNETQDTYPFSYKTWVPTTESVHSKDNSETLKVLDLSRFDKTKYTNNNNGLTADDIRGAVGGSEAIPGLSSSSDANRATNGEEKPVESSVAPSETPAESPTETITEAPVDIPVETPVETVVEASTEKNVDGDVEMKD